MVFLNAIAVAIIVISVIYIGLSIWGWSEVDTFTSISTDVDRRYTKRILKILGVIVVSALWLVFG